MTSAGRRVAVIGGGVTGLVAAYRLTETSRHEVFLIEGASRLGGKLHSDEIEGVVLDAGPDSFLPRDRRPLEICSKLGLDDDLIQPAVFGGLILAADGLRAPPPQTIHGVPPSVAALLSSRVTSPQAALRAAFDLVRPGPLRGGDVSVASLIEDRLGREVLDNLVDPLLAGTRAGRVADMSLAAATPELDAIARNHRSLMRGVRAATATGAAVGRRSFFGLRRGMGSLVDALSVPRERLQILLSKRAARIVPTQSGYRVELPGGHVDVEGVVVAIPADSAAPLLNGVAPDASGELARIDHASMAVLALVYPPTAVRIDRHQRASGFLVPSRARRELVACTFTSRKWPHLRPRDGGEIVRCVVGRAGRDTALDFDDHDLAARVHGELQRALGVAVPPRTYKVFRWDRSLPEYRVGHLDRLARVEGALRRHPAIALAGASYRGSGIAACIDQAERAADRLLEALRTAHAARG